MNYQEPLHLDFDALFLALKNYLGDDGCYWLCACAIYPELNWNLTQYLGYNLRNSQDEVLFSQEKLSLLSQLPWFRIGRMPNWLRKYLIRRLSIQEEKNIRICLNKLLLTASDRPLNSFALSFAKERSYLFTRLSKFVLQKLFQRQRTNIVMSDHIFVSFISDNLAVKIPKVLRSLLFRYFVSIKISRFFNLKYVFQLISSLIKQRDESLVEENRTPY